MDPTRRLSTPVGSCGGKLRSVEMALVIGKRARWRDPDRSYARIAQSSATQARTSGRFHPKVVHSTLATHAAHTARSAFACTTPAHPKAARHANAAHGLSLTAHRPFCAAFPG